LKVKINLKEGYLFVVYYANATLKCSISVFFRRYEIPFTCRM